MTKYCKVPIVLTSKLKRSFGFNITLFDVTLNNVKSVKAKTTVRTVGYY